MNMNVKLESSEIIRPHIILPCPRMVAVASNTLLNDVPTITMYNYITSSYLQSDLITCEITPRSARDRYNVSLRGVRSFFSSTVHCTFCALPQNWFVCVFSCFLHRCNCITICMAVCRQGYFHFSSSALPPGVVSPVNY